MDQLSGVSEHSKGKHWYRTLNVAVAVVLLVMLASVAYGFYCFRITSVCVGDNLRLTGTSNSEECFTNATSPQITINYKGIPAKTIKAAFDGQEVTLRRCGWWGCLQFETSNLSDGQHLLSVRAGRYASNWAFEVDTDIPAVEFTSPSQDLRTSAETVVFSGTTKPQCTVNIKVGNQNLRCLSDTEGCFSTELPLVHGRNEIKWTISDRASNAIKGSFYIQVDLTAPIVEPILKTLDGGEQATPKTANAIFSQRNLVLHLTVKDPDSGIVKTAYKLDQKQATLLPIPSADDNSPVLEENNADESETSDDSSNTDRGEEDDLPTEIDDSTAQLNEHYIANYAVPQRARHLRGAHIGIVHSDTKADADVGFIQVQSGETSSEDNSESDTNSDKAPSSVSDNTVDTPEQGDASPQPSPTPTLQPLKTLEVTALKLPNVPEKDIQGRATAYKIPVNSLADGDHVIEIISTNGVGVSSRRTLNFKVNSSDKLGEATLTLGAIGNDVLELQKRLYKRGYLKGDYTKGKYDRATHDAVVALQRHIGVAADGVAGPAVFGAIDKRVYVNLTRYEAKLVLENDSVYTYPICIGVDEHPTPTGCFYIADKVKYPTWLPPNSEWAKDAKVIEPGPDNPLGTRWIGLDGGSIGFHGTLYPDSIGTKASHGCMRMRRDDVEDFYNRVSVGTQVRIYAGTEDDSILHSYWP